LESQPSGADAKTSLGPGCETACSVSVPARDGGFSVSYSLAKYQPATVQVKVIRNPGDLTTPASATTESGICEASAGRSAAQGHAPEEVQTAACRPASR